MILFYICNMSLHLRALWPCSINNSLVNLPFTEFIVLLEEQGQRTLNSRSCEHGKSDTLS